MLRERQTAPGATNTGAATTKETNGGQQFISKVDCTTTVAAYQPADEIATLKAQNERLRRERDEIVRIMGAASWAVNERLVYVTLRRLVADGRRVNGWLVKVTPTWQVAKTCGLPQRTCRDVMRRLQSATLIDWEVERPSGADFDEAITTISVKECMPVAFAPLPATSRGESDKRRKVEWRARVKQLQAIVNELACPSCGEIGCLHVKVGATCSECHAEITQDDLEKRLGIGKADKAGTRRKLRDVKARSTSPKATERNDFDAGGTGNDDGITHVSHFVGLVADSATTPPLRRAQPDSNKRGVHCRLGSKQAVNRA